MFRESCVMFRCVGHVAEARTVIIGFVWILRPAQHQSCRVILPPNTWPGAISRLARLCFMNVENITLLFQLLAGLQHDSSLSNTRNSGLFCYYIEHVRFLWEGQGNGSRVSCSCGLEND